MKTPYFFLTGTVLLLSACTWFSPVETVEVWDFDRCISEGGLVVAEPPKCLVGEEEHPLSNTGGILEVPTVHDWSDEAFFDALRALDEPLDFTWDVDIPLVGELGGMALHTVEDLLLYMPRTHEDLTEMSTIESARLNEKVSIRGTVHALRLIRTRSHKMLVKGNFTDTEGSEAEVVWFNQPHITRMLTDGEEVVLTGKLILHGKKVQFQSPQFESTKIRGQNLVHAGRLVPVYPQHEIITSKWLREKITLIKDAITEIPETLPEAVLEEEHLLPRSDAVYALHFPDDASQVERALQRMEFEEMYRVQKEALERKREWQGRTQERLKIPMDIELIRAL